MYSMPTKKPLISFNTVRPCSFQDVAREEGEEICLIDSSGGQPVHVARLTDDGGDHLQVLNDHDEVQSVIIVGEILMKGIVTAVGHVRLVSGMVSKIPVTLPIKISPLIPRRRQYGLR